jgi:hypothetical protein
MQIAERLDQLITIEHRAVIAALDAAEAAVRAIEDRNNVQPELDAKGRPIRGRMFTAPIVDLKRLLEAWEPWRVQVRARVERVHVDLRPLVDSEDDDALYDLASDLAEEHETLERLLAQIKGQVLFIDELKRPMRELFHAVDGCDRVEQGEILPAILDDDRAADLANRFRTSDDISRSLRVAGPRPPPEPEPEKGLVSRLFESFLRR